MFTNLLITYTYSYLQYQAILGQSIILGQKIILQSIAITTNRDLTFELFLKALLYFYWNSVHKCCKSYLDRFVKSTRAFLIQKILFKIIGFSLHVVHYCKKTSFTGRFAFPPLSRSGMLCFEVQFPPLPISGRI